MSFRPFVLGLVLALAGLAGQISAQETRTEQVRFAAGATGTSLTDSLQGRQNVLYKVGAEAGQRLTVSLTSDNLATYFNVYGPGSGPGDEALAVGSITGPRMPDLNRFDALLETSGDYTISVYLYRAAARRGETTQYDLSISATGGGAEVVQGDFADGLAGGPDFYRVQTRNGGTLNLRAAPSSGGAVVMRLADGTTLRNLGCRMAEGQRWCRVATLADAGSDGWAAGEFLVEGSAEATPPPAPPPDASGPVRVRFSDGGSGAELTGDLGPGESRRYVMGARDGQDLYVRVAPSLGSMAYQIFNPDGSFLLDQTTSDREYRGQLWQSGDHVVEVINRNSQRMSYNVIFGIE